MDKMPAYRWRDSIRLASFLKGIGPQIAKALEPKMAAVLEEGEQLPDLAHLLDVLGRMVVAEQDRFDKKDMDKHRHAGSAASVRLELRRDVMPELRARVKQVRKWMRTHINPGTLKIILPFKGRTPRSDEGLEDLAKLMVRRLADRKPIQTPGGPVDPAGWAEYLREPLAKASGLLGEIDGYHEGKSLSAKQKAEAMKSYDKLFRRVARVGWIFCHLGGIEKTARHLVYRGGRPGEKIKKPRRRVNVA